MQVNIDKETVEPNWHIAQNKVAQLFKQTFQCCRQPNTFSGNLTWCWLAERNNRSLRAHMVEQIDVSALSETRFQEESVHGRGAPARFR
jgi:hypothetical protein